MTAGTCRTLSVEVCADAQAFGELAGEWERLYRACRSATPFQSHTWLHSWWLSYGTPGALRVVLVRRSGGELVAAAPLMRVHRPLPVLVPVGGAISDFCDVLLDEAVADLAVPALADALAGLARTALIDFREVRPGSAVERVFHSWQGPRHRVPDSLCLELPAVPMDELVGRLSSKRAQRVRNRMNKLARIGVRWRTVGAEETGAALGRLIELHRLQWEGRKVTPEHLRPRFLDHLVRSVVPMARRGEAVVKEYLLEDEVVAVDLTFQSRQLAGKYLYGVHPRLRERKVDVTTMMLTAAVEELPAQGPAVLSLLRGAEPYKYQWRPRGVVNQRLLLARRRTAPLLAAVACEAAARARAKRVLRRAPADPRPVTS
ncbi:GNAT family N-acetyltransferase [Streptomyces bungoensis]|uniref:GNAT family N-acetyltransferase n=1 Tax=Streptomyces bungoensis TaxID=285568 RepID=UPI003421D026